jgi:hypothetical protein
MRNLLAFQEFEPQESRLDERCIWCKQPYTKNRSHIFSRKLTNTNNAVNVFGLSVCEQCNSNFSKLELWILRNTPLAWLRVLSYGDSNKQTETKAVLSYFYATEFNDWLVYSIRGDRQEKHILPQLVLNAQSLFFISEDPPEIGMNTHQRILYAIRDSHYVERDSQRLPSDFSPRALIRDEKVTVVGRDMAEINRFTTNVLSSTSVPSEISHCQPAKGSLDFQHFRWSRYNWGMFCTKIAFESLCLFEGATFCLRSEFDRVRSYATSNLSTRSREIVFNQHGPVASKDTPSSVFLDLTTEQNFPKALQLPLINTEPGMHAIAVFQIDGWTCSTVSVGGFPSTLLVLANNSTTVHDFYITLYDEQEDNFHHLRLAFDETKPVIPISVGGKIDTIARSYDLKYI